MSRYYDPQVGRFINADGLIDNRGVGTTQNMFQYCGNNPVNYADPTGMCHGYPTEWGYFVRDIPTGCVLQAEHKAAYDASTYVTLNNGGTVHDVKQDRYTSSSAILRYYTPGFINKSAY